MLKIIGLTLTGVILLLGETAFAQQEADATARFNEADEDSDGSLTRNEFNAYVTEKLPTFYQFDALMKQLDTDKDGIISKVEFGKRRSVTQKLVDEAPVEFADGFNTRYATKKPWVGDSLGELVAYDASGNELDFESLKGKYTVFNFGCLT